MSTFPIVLRNIEYQIIKELGRGASGRVIKVLNKSDNKYYAIKEIETKDNKKEIIKEFENEVNILSKFYCNNIIKYYDSYRYAYKNKFCILMEYCEGQNLKDFINKYRNKNELIDDKILYTIIKKLCICIKEIHNKKIIHRDLKPENIFINDNMDIKIGDFGISKLFSSNKAYYETKDKA